MNARTAPDSTSFVLILVPLVLAASGIAASAQQAPYNDPPPVEPPYYRVRYAASTEPGALQFPVQYTIWIPADVETLRGVIVHQHGCGQGSAMSGQTGAFDLHWQALATKHDCALLSPSYEQPEDGECFLWCDPRNGSADAFQRGLEDLGEQSGHPELATVPWALWGHSGGGVWAGTMTLLYPERVAAAWLRSGTAMLEAREDRPEYQPMTLKDAALKVPMLCNLGTKEGYSVTEGRFAGVWPRTRSFFQAVRAEGGLIAVAIDPLSSHECGNQRYLAIPWFDACLTARLPETVGEALRQMPGAEAWLAPLEGAEAAPANEFGGKAQAANWLPNATVARAWMEYVKDTEVTDETPPPAPTAITVDANRVTWTAAADLESGIGHFLIERDGEVIATVPEKPSNRFGRPLFQGLQYSDTPAVPLVEMSYTDDATDRGDSPSYRVITVNTRGLRSDGKD